MVELCCGIDSEQSDFNPEWLYCPFCGEKFPVTAGRVYSMGGYI